VCGTRAPSKRRRGEVAWANGGRLVLGGDGSAAMAPGNFLLSPATTPTRDHFLLPLLVVAATPSPAMNLPLVAVAVAAATIISTARESALLVFEPSQRPSA
jgi:hypothetical protein